MCESLSVTCRRSVVSSGYSGFLTYHHHHHDRLDMTLAVAEVLDPKTYVIWLPIIEKCDYSSNCGTE